MVDNLGSTSGWTGSVGSFLSNSDLIAWEASTPLGISSSAEFWFTTEPVELALTNGIIADFGLTTFPGGLLLVPTAAPIPPGPPPLAPFPTLLVTTAEDKDDKNVGFTSLREAINWVEDNQRPNNQLKLGFSAGIAGSIITITSQLPLISHNIFINGTDRNITVERDVLLAEFRLIDGNTGSKIEIAELTLKNGGGGTFNGNGGAIRALGDLTLVRCTIQNNFADNGGGVYCAGVLSITDCVIEENQARVSGGGVYAAGNVTIRGTRLLDGTQIGKIVDNMALSRGGGIYAAAGNVTIETMLIADNKAVNPIPLPLAPPDRGGGIFIDENVTQANIFDTYIMTNTATGLGGGVFIAGGSVTLEKCYISENNQAGRGAGVAIMNGTLTVIDTTISNNQTIGATGFGGGVFIGAQANAVSFFDSVIGGNSATTSGGGIWIEMPQTGVNLAVTLDNTWVVANSAATEGGGIGVAWQTMGGGLQLILKNDTFIAFNTLTNNNAVGGGLFLGYGTVTFDGVTFETNIAHELATGFFAVSGTQVIDGQGSVIFDDDSWFIDE